MSDNVPRFVHDTNRIIDVNPAACELFRCEPIALIDREMVDLLIDNTYRGLARLRLAQLATHARLPPFLYLFHRCDGSEFWGCVLSNRLDDVRFETRVIYIDER